MSSAAKKLLTFIIIMLIAIAAIVGCVYVLTELGQSKKSSVSSSITPEISAAQVNKEVIEEIGYEDISELDSGDISGHIDVPEDSVTQTSIYIADSSSSAVELACFKLKNPNDNKAILEAISKHIALKLKGYSQSPKESELIRNYVTDTCNGYVFMVISESPEAAAMAFRDAVNNKN